MSNTVHPTPATSAGAGAVATSTQRPPLRRGGSARHCRTMPPSPRPFAPPFSPRKARPLVPRDLRPPLRSLRGSRPRYRAHGAATARISRPCFVSGAVFRPLLLPAPASVAGVGCPVFHVEQFTFVKYYFTFVKCNFTIVK